MFSDFVSSAGRSAPLDITTGALCFVICRVDWLAECHTVQLSASNACVSNAVSLAAGCVTGLLSGLVSSAVRLAEP